MDVAMNARDVRQALRKSCSRGQKRTSGYVNPRPLEQFNFSIRSIRDFDPD